MDDTLTRQKTAGDRPGIPEDANPLIRGSSFTIETEKPVINDISPCLMKNDSEEEGGEIDVDE